MSCISNNCIYAIVYCALVLASSQYINSSYNALVSPSLALGVAHIAVNTFFINGGELCTNL